MNKMTLTIECECGNRVTVSAPPKKYLQLRDNLETGDFKYGGSKIKGVKVEEIRICCDKCGKYMDLGLD